MHALFSGRGWSACVSTSKVDDPYPIAAGSIAITRRVPHRNGMYRRGILDGFFDGSTDVTQTWELLERADEWVTPRYMDIVKLVDGVAESISTCLFSLFRSSNITMTRRFQIESKARTLDPVGCIEWSEEV